jgi:acyl carrier protein
MDIKSTLRNYIVTEIMHERDLSVLADDTALIEGGIIDSMSLIQLVLVIKEKFGVEVAEEELDIENFKTLNSLTGYILSKIEGK